MALPSFNTNIRELSLMQSAWATQLNPVLANPLTSSVILQNVSLSTGDNVINTTLGRKLQGWYIVRQRAAASIYDKQDSNNMPALTLVLNASAPVVVDLAVF